MKAAKVKESQVGSSIIILAIPSKTKHNLHLFFKDFSFNYPSTSKRAYFWQTA